MKPEPAQLGAAQMAWWQYGPRPSELDLVRNHLAARGVRIVLHVIVRAYLRVFHPGAPASRADARRLRGLRGHLIVANHTSHLDALVLMSAFPLWRVNAVRSLCARDYFFGHPVRRAIAFFLGNSIPMDRTRYDARAIAFCREQIRRGANVIVFPEGTRSPDGRMGAFLGGVGLLAVRYGLPVLPACIRGAHECCPKGAIFPRPGRIEVLFGQPVRYRACAGGKRDWLAAAEDLQARVRALQRQLNLEHAHDTHASHEPHEQDADQDDEAADPHAGAPQRRHPHRPRARVHLGQDGGLRIPQPAVR